MLIQIVWSGTSTLVAIIAEDTCYIIRFDREAYTQKVESGEDPGDEGIAEAFEVVAEINERYTLSLSRSRDVDLSH